MGNKHMNVMKKNKKNHRNTISSNIVSGNNIQDREIIPYNISKSPHICFKMDPKFSFGDGLEGSTSDYLKYEGEEDKGKNENKKVCKNLEKNISFDLIRIIGKGYYSKVYLAKVIVNYDDNKYKMKVPHYMNENLAIKVIKKKNIFSGNNLEALQKILNEKKILQILSIKDFRNEFIINLLDFFQDEKNLYLIFPFYQEDLFSFCKYTRQMNLFDENIIKFILAQMYLAITYLHENKILYRDIKPENVVIDRKTGYIILIDFGLAVNEVTSESKISELCGTFEYIPPEVIRGDQYNFNLDWWGFGIFFYEMIYGHPPFTGGNQTDIFKKILKNEIMIENDGISNETKDLLFNLLYKEKENRIKPELIRFHPFFKDVDFDAINERKVTSPLLSILKDKYFGDKYFVDKNNFLDEDFFSDNKLQKENFEVGKIKIEPKDILINQDLFKDF